MPPTMPPNADDARTDATVVTRRLRAEIVEGVVPPGSKLKLVPLAQRYQVGRGPLREAACRLAAEGLVLIEDQRGFRVAPISRTDLIDVTRTRQRIEALALRDAILHGDDEWEGKVLAALHVLERVSSPDASEARRAQFQERHRAFHDILCAPGPSAYIRQFRDTLYAHSERYRCLAADRYIQQITHRDIAAEHEALARAALDRDADLACRRLENHLERTLETLLDGYPILFGEAEGAA